MRRNVRIFLAVFALIMLSVSTAYAIFCTKCGTENPDDAKFCYRCGAGLGAGTQGYVVCRPIQDNYEIDGISANEYNRIKLLFYCQHCALLNGNSPSTCQVNHWPFYKHSRQTDQDICQQYFQRK